MSMEDIVRRELDFEGTVKQFREQIRKFSADCRLLDTGEMEICMARLYDTMSQAAEEAERLDKLFKGRLVKKVYDKRKAGEPVSSWAWLQRQAKMVDYVIEWHFDYPVRLTEGLANEWADGAEQAIGPAPAEECATLRGLRGVFVLVALEPWVERYGLTDEALQTDTELHLRQYGVKVLSEDEWLRTPGQPCLNVEVTPSLQEESGDVAASVNVSLSQTVFLTRDRTVEYDAETWSEDMLTTIGHARLCEVRHAVQDLVAKFINDYLTVNR